MKAAFNAQFPADDNEVVSTTSAEEDPTYNEDLWSRETSDQSASFIESERISCFAHTLQLSIGDGLVETKAISVAMSKGVKVTSSLHRSTKYKVRIRQWYH